MAPHLRAQVTRRGFIKSACVLCGALLLKGCAPGIETTELEVHDPKIWEAAYLQLESEGKLTERILQAYAVMEKCELCPRRCGVNRLNGEIGFCRSPKDVVVYSYGPHLGEELPLIGRYGSGTIFFSHCNLRCVFCQNWPIAHEGRGKEATPEALASMMLDLQSKGCHNVNLVTPTHAMPNILKATQLAIHGGLKVPLVYNTSGYERVEMIELLDRIVDIYLPDLKFMDGAQAERYNLAAAFDYPVRAQEAINEMHRQVGDLVTTEAGYAQRGLMVRHLVMPNRVAGTEAFVHWVAENLSIDTYVNIMAQYRVEYKAFEYEEIARSITPEEFVEAIDWAIDAGLTNLDERSMSHYKIHRQKIP
jgi:putative pyruvate formate lyase activating enzyme